MKKVSKKVREGIIGRFFLTAKELPNSISFSQKVDGWEVYKCEGSYTVMYIAYKSFPIEQFIKWA